MFVAETRRTRGRASKTAGLIGLAAGLFAWAFGPAPADAQTYAGKIGVEAAERQSAFIDLGKTHRPFWKLDDTGATPYDSSGWPMSDGLTVLFDNRPVPAWAPPIDDPQGVQPDMSGIYKLSFTGQADLAVREGPATISNKTYDAPSNTTRADVTFSAGTWQTAPAILVLSFTNTKRTSASPTNTGITNMKFISPGYTEAQATSQIFTTEYLNAYAPFAYIRFMGWADTNYSAWHGGPGNEEIAWSQRQLPSDASQDLGQDFRHGAQGLAWEYMIQLANKTNKDMWINIPVSATGSSTTDTTSYVYKLAQAIRYGTDANGNPYTSTQANPVWPPLNSNLNIYLEHSNEVWNFGFTQYAFNKDRAVTEVNQGGSNLNSDGSTDQETWARRRHAKRLYQCSKIFETVFGAGSLNTRIRPVYCAWTIFPGSYYTDVLTWLNGQYGAPRNYLYAIGCTNYFNDQGARVAGYSVAQVLSAMTTDSNNGVSYTQQLAGIATAWTLRLFAYEGGPDNGGGDTTNIGNRILANRDPGMQTLVQNHYRNNWFPRGGDMCTYFTAFSAFSRYGCWGASDDNKNTSSVKWQAIYNLTGFTPGNNVQAPVFNPAPGTYSSAQSVAISTSTSGATIRYTTDGSNPTSSSGTIYSAPVSIAATATLKAIAYKSGMTDSAVTSGTYTISTGGGPLPAGWTDADIGGPAVAGSGTYDSASGTFTIKGSGGDIWGGSDQFNYAYRSVSGDQTVTARVTAVQNTDGWAKSGVMMRDGTGANAMYAAAQVTPGNGVRFQFRTTTGGSASDLAGPASAAPYWVRLVRSGNSFSAYASSDGSTWTQIGTTQTIAMATAYTGGLAVTAHNNTVLNTSTFTNVSVAASGSVPAAPTGLAATPGNAQVTLNWNAVTGATGYKVYYSTGGNYYSAGTPATNTFTHTGLTNGTTYSYYVTATNAVGEGPASSVVTATPTGTPVGPAGYTYVANEGQSYDFGTQVVDLAYGANGAFNYLYGRTGTITFDNATFGDPIVGTVKYGFYKVSTSGTGTGLRGDYYGTTDLTGAVVLTRTDTQVNFDWGSGSPGTGVNADLFSVRWTGQVQATVTGNYIFSTTSDDGVRLWVNGVQVINNWTLHGPTTDNSAAIALTAGQKYDIRMEYYENTGGAVAKLLWTPPGGSLVAIPQSQLYPTPAPANPIAAGTPTIDGTIDAVWASAVARNITRTLPTISSSSDCSATWKALWDANNLYLLVEVTDDVKNNDSTNPWDDDSIEIYVDGNNDKTTAYDTNDRQVVCGWNDAAPVEGAGRSITGVTFSKADPTGTTYRMEVKIPWSTLGVTASGAKNIGIDVHINDDDDGTARDGKLMWNDPNNPDQAWGNPSVFGTATLN